MIVFYSDWSGLTRTDAELDVRFTKREFGGYYVTRRDNGRKLGWVFKTAQGDWAAYVDSSAFCGRSLTDTGRAMDEVPEHLAGTIAAAKRVSYEHTREWAASDLVSYLSQKSATAMTGKQHYAVKEHTMPVWLAKELGYTPRDTDYASRTR